ncbi:HK97 gp10 family phage protein [Tatumella terrea]|uniref:HK97 gp10 family phage protein n=1 Tax=Tatumella terrea TaxID=419007 RepID=A0ABW1VX60_9GAMM
MAQGWDLDPSAFSGVVEEKVNIKARAIAVQILGAIVETSPVDTGRFRNNNLVSIDSPDYRQTDSDVGADLPAGSTRGVGSYDEGVTLLNSNPQKIKYPVIYIQNNLPYAEVLEQGHSKQAPTGIYANAFNGVAQANK